MGQSYRGLILAFVGLCSFILLITQNIDALPYHADGTEDTDESLGGKSTKSTETSVESDPPDSEELSVENGGSLRRDRRDARDRFSKSSFRRSFTDTYGMQSDAKFVFPEEDTAQPVQRVPVCEGSTYCTEVDNYPEQIVNAALRRNESLKYLAYVDAVSSDLVQRINVDDEMPLCISSEQVIFPKAAENKDNEWKFVVNQKDFQQGVRIEKCSQENTDCRLVNGPGVNYKATCRQKFVYRQLTAVLENGSVVTDTFKFPSSCCCHVSSIRNTLTRSGFMKQESNVTPIKTRMRK
ncbi:protein spaetzle 5 [Halictus rubicundus]|uniref:protein spaetzle 5 n=1 Tax=Halictus rubicundus TaxID=77578 RepID=UPI0040366605